MKRILLGILLISVILVAGCTQTEIICNKPYIKVGTDCCLDVNDNGICDKDETTTTTTIYRPTTTVATTVPTTTALLNKASLNIKYIFFDYENKISEK